MAYTLLAGGYRQTITTLTFDPTNKSKSIEVVAESPTPANPSWLEVAGDKVYAVSETDEDGKAVLLDLTKKDGDVKLEVKREEVTGDAPCHILVDLPRVFFANVRIFGLVDTIRIRLVCSCSYIYTYCILTSTN